MPSASDIKTEIDETYRNFVTDGVPASGAHQPEKDDIRPLLKSMVDFSTSSGTTLVFATVADLEAYDDTDLVEGSRAEVRADPGGDNEDFNGIWKYSGTAWEWISDLIPEAVATELGALDARLDTAEADITALDGRLDTAETDIAALETGLSTETTNRTNADTALDTAKANKSVTVTGGGLATGGGDLSANRTITVTKASSAEVITGTEDAKAVTPLALAPSLTALDTRLDTLEAQNPDAELISQPQPIVKDLRNSLGGGIAVYVHKNWFRQRPNGVPASVTVTNTVSSEIMDYVKLTVPSLGTVSAIFYDTVDNEYVIYGYSGSNIPVPDADKPFLEQIMTLWSSGHTTKYNVIDAADGTRLNQSIFSRDTTNAPRKSGTITHTALSESVLTGSPLFLVKGASAATAAYAVGDNVLAVPGGKIAVRFFIESTVDDVFGSPQAYFWNNGSFVETFSVRYVRRLSARAREYEATYKLPASGLVNPYYIVGLQSMPASGANYVCGVMHHVSDADYERVSRIYFPTVPMLDGVYGDVSEFNIVYPADMWLNAGRKMPLYPKQITKVQSELMASVAHFWTYNTNTIYAQEHSGRDCLIIDPDTVGTVGGIDFRRFGQPTSRTDYRYRLPLTIHTGPASATGTIKVHFIGDSLTNREQPKLCAKILEAIGYTVECIGTMQNQGGGTNSVPLYGGEAREGREWADFIYDHTDAVTPLTPGDETTYRALGDGDKNAVNPYLKTPTAGDIADKPTYIKNSYIFDFDFYLTRFGFDDPDVVVINLGQNDVAQQSSAEALLQMQTAFPIIYNQIREALPDAHIAFVANISAKYGFSDAEWTTDRYPTLIVEQMKLVNAERTGGDTKVWFVPAYAHMNAETGFGNTTQSTDADTGMLTQLITDYIHFYDHGRYQYANVTAAFVNCVTAGV